MTTRTWVRKAACRSIDPELFFSGHAADRAAAQGFCARCPVQPRCLDDVLEAEGSASRSDRFGIVAGLTPRERRDEYERRVSAGNAFPPVRRLLQPCGTAAAYRRHLRHGEPADSLCLQAERVARAARLAAS